MGRVSADPISAIPTLKDLQEVNEGEPIRSQGAVNSTEMKPHIKRVKHRLKL